MKTLSLEQMEKIEGGQANCLYLFYEWNEAYGNFIETNSPYYLAQSIYYSQEMMNAGC